MKEPLLWPRQLNAAYVPLIVDPAIAPVTRYGHRVTSLGERVKVTELPLMVPDTDPPPLQAVFAYVIVQVPVSAEPFCANVTRAVPVVHPIVGAAVSVAKPDQLPASCGMLGALGLSAPQPTMNAKRPRISSRFIARTLLLRVH